MQKLNEKDISLIDKNIDTCVNFRFKFLNYLLNKLGK